jgi:cytoskeletal protein RodZ
MPTVGEQLRSARERARLSVHDLANALNMKADQVRAVEESRWAEFGAPVYIRGFVRTMSRQLKLDTAQMMAEIEVELGQTEEYASAPSLTIRRKGPLDFLMLQLSRIRWAVVLPVLLGIGVIAAVLYGLRRTEKNSPQGRSQQLGSGLYPGRRAPGNLTLPLPTNAPPAFRRP